MQERNESMQPILNLSQDRKLVWHRGDSIRHLVVEVEAPSAPPVDGAQVRVPLNLAIVVDRSGSMEGTPLENAKLATCLVVDQLADGDLLSVVGFDDSVVVLVDDQEITATSRASIKSRIMEMQSGGMTDLAAGWLRGAECVAQSMQQHQRSQVVVLSDGHANQGIVDPTILAEQASGLRNRGISTSCIGVGDHYSVDQIQALARHGGGRLHDAELPAEILEVLLGDLGEAQATVLENVVLSLDLPAGVTVQCLSDFPKQEQKFSLGSFAGEAKRQAIFRVRFPAGGPGHELPIGAWISGTLVESGQSVKVQAESVMFTQAIGKDNSAQARNDEAAVQVATVWHAKIVQRATSMNRDVDYQGAARYVKKEVRYFKKYVAGLEKAAEWLENLHRFQDVVVDFMPERQRKNIQLAASKAMYLEADHRSAPRQAWSDQY